MIGPEIKRGTAELAVLSVLEAARFTGMRWPAHRAANSRIVMIHACFALRYFIGWKARLGPWRVKRAARAADGAATGLPQGERTLSARNGPNCSAR